ncbi:MAG: chain-length determining protein [Algicola sp.]|nr:chain-length determining protein [Algicola sp.]
MSQLLTRSYTIMAGAWRQRYTIILPIVLLPMLGVLVSLMSTPKYQSHMSFLVQETGKDNPYLTDLTVDTNLKGRISGLKTLLHSRHILTSVVEELSTDEEPLDDGQMEYRIGLLSSAINVQLIGSNLINIRMFSNNPREMKKTLDAVSKHFITSLLAPGQSSISSSETFLKQELVRLEVTLRQAEEKMAEYKRTHADELPESHQLNISRLRHSQGVLEEKRVQLAGAKLVIGNLQSKVLELDPVLADLENNLVKLKSDLSMKRARYTDKHSSVRALLRKIGRLEKERKRLFAKAPVSTENIERFWSIRQSGGQDQGSSDLLMSQISALQTEQHNIKRLTEEVAHLETNIKVLDKRVRSFGKNEKVLRELEREINVKSKVFEDLMERYEKAKVSRSLGEFEAKDRIKVIDKPFDPIRPLNLPLLVFVIFGVVGGLFTGISFAVMNELMNNKLYDVAQIEAITGVDVIARLPNFNQNSLEALPHG